MLKTQFYSGIQHGLINWNPMVSDNDPRRCVAVWRELPPLMLSNIINPVSLCWIYCQYLRKEVLCIIGQCFGHFIFSSQYLLIEFRSLRIFKRKASAQHCIEYYSTTPNINKNSLIPVFPLNHFRSSITWGSTRSLQSLLFPVSVGQPKINDPYSFVIIN